MIVPSGHMRIFGGIRGTIDALENNDISLRGSVTDNRGSKLPRLDKSQRSQRDP